MKTVRTVLATLAGVLLAYSLTAWISVRQDAAFVQRTIYQGFDQTFIIALVMGGAFLLITVILSVAIASTGEEVEDDSEEEEYVDMDEDEEEEEVKAPAAPAKHPAGKDGGYRRPAHAPQRNLEDVLKEDEEEPDAEKITFAKPAQAEKQPAPAPERQPESTEAPKPEAPKAESPKAEPDTVYCIYCGSKVDAKSAFCPQCGNKL